MKYLISAILTCLPLGLCQAQNAIETAEALRKIPGVSGMGSDGGGVIHSIVFGNPMFNNDQVMRDVMKVRPGLKHLRELRVGYAGLTDAGAKEVHGLPDLQDLRLDNNRITDAGVEAFKQLPSLKMLALNDNPINGTGFKNAKDLPKLETLALNGCPVTDAGLEKIAEHAGLRMLALSGRGVSDAGMKHLQRLKALDKFYFVNARISDAGLRELKDLPLHTLRLTGAPVSGAGLEGFKSLRILEFGNSQITDAGLKGLAGLSQLNNLDLSGTRVTNEGLKELAVLKNVGELDLSKTKVVGASLKELGAMKGLHTVRLSPEQIDDAGLRALIDADLLRLYSAAIKKEAGNSGRPRNNAEIGRLFLMKCPITDESVKALASLKSLEILNVRDTRLTDAGIAQLKEAFPKLKLLR